jgi:hypothetical protein
MSTHSVEQRLDSLETRNKKLEHEIERLQAVNEIQNLMARYEYWHTAMMNEEIGAMFAEKAPGVRVEYIHSGVYEGTKSVRKFLVDVHNRNRGKGKAGILSVHALTTPCIEVAKDGKTARAVWLSPGYGAYPSAEGKIKAHWGLEEYAVDFIKEDGIWKFWRVHLYRIFMTPFDKSWTEEEYKAPTIDLPDKLRADRPTTYNKPYNPNGLNNMVEFVPPAPEPYETYDESMAVVK